VWNNRDGHTMAGFMAEDVVCQDLGLGQVFTGRDAIVRAVDETAAFSADYRRTLLAAFQAGADYAWEWEMRGTNTGAAGGMPATGKAYAVRGASVGHLDEHGRILRHRDHWNMADYLMQVGLLTPPPKPWVQ
jgi:steroid delta-isomerase-like uncharacterized protein